MGDGVPSHITQLCSLVILVILVIEVPQRLADRHLGGCDGLPYCRRQAGRGVSDLSAIPGHPADLDLIALVVAAQAELPAMAGLTAEHAAIIQLCQYPLSVAELSAHLSLPLGPVRILLWELLDRGLILACDSHSAGPAPTDHVLKAVRNGLRSL